ncbi:Hsp70 family protein [Nocardia sp. NBC_00565]|uniref:Hsp70 family protein n=1 Tax=Nocardia sp. NBC_00565 TaxID=2975993 RepID=UPI002E7FCE95|nr:Hsp70 family protein [Nocardia sp. NBC_00565]WUC02955.1 Hsp70 family protein [Nocardia sp. NBC_00565]
MRTSLGISAGNEVVCSALVATASNGAQSFDYRVVSADAAHSDLGDLVASSIELMTTQLPTTQLSYDVAFPAHPVGARFAGAKSIGVDSAAGRPPTSVAVAYRSKEQEQVIRSATGKQRELRLIPEGVAALTYLRHTGLVDRYDTIAIVDLGATGLSITVADQADSTILRTERIGAVSGNAIDELIYHHLVDLHYARRGTRPNRGMLTNRGRAAKEHLSIAPAVTIDHVAGQPLKLTRADFEELISDLLRETAVFAAAVFARAPKFPQAVIVIGGGANIPAVISTLAAELDLPVHTIDDPEAVIAKGAALVADSTQPSVFPVAALGGVDAPIGTFTKVVGTLAGAIVVVGLVIGYGVKTFAPTGSDDISPAGTTSSAQLPTPPVSVVPATGAGTSTSGPSRESANRPSGANIPSLTPDRSQPPISTASTPAATTAPNAPTLRPDPNLPPIPFPELLGPLFGNPSVPGSPGPDHDPAQGSSTVPPTSTAPTQAPAQTRIPSLPKANSGSSTGPWDPKMQSVPGFQSSSGQQPKSAD